MNEGEGEGEGEERGEHGLESASEPNRRARQFSVRLLQG